MRRRELLQWGAGLLSPLCAWPVSAAPKPKKVIVAGAGLAGLTSAYELTKRGHDVTVLEASNRTGGHVHTIRDGLPDGLYADVGAEHFTKPGYDLCWTYFDELNLPVIPYPHRDNMLRLVDGRMMPEGEAVALEQSRMSAAGFNTAEIGYLRKHPSGNLLNLYFQRSIERIHDEYQPFGVGLDHLDDVSVQELLRQDGASAAAIREVGSEDSALHTIWKLAILRLRGVDEDPHALFRVKGGNQVLPDAIAKCLGPRIRTGKPVTAIRHSAQGVQVTCGAGKETVVFEGEYLICALNAVALRHVQVSPEWAEPKQYAIQNVPYTVESRPLFLSRTKFWKADGYSGNMDFGTPALGEIWPMADEVQTPRGLLIGAAQAGATAAKALSVFRRYYPGTPTIETASLFDWSHDPWSMVCEARTYRPGQLGRMWPAIIAPEGRVYFAGAYCDNQSWGMEAATRSAMRAARAVHEA